MQEPSAVGAHKLQLVGFVLMPAEGNSFKFAGLYYIMIVHVQVVHGSSDFHGVPRVFIKRIV